MKCKAFVNKDGKLGGVEAFFSELIPQETSYF